MLMAFQIVLNSAMIPMGDNLESQAISFLVRIGYFSENKKGSKVRKKSENTMGIEDPQPTQRVYDNFINYKGDGWS